MIGFGNYTRMDETGEIKRLTDNRLVLIDPQEEYFFDKVETFKSTNNDINSFIEAIREVKEAKLEAFYKPIYDPSVDNNKISYRKGKKPGTCRTVRWWVENVPKMPAVEDRHWCLGSEHHYYTFLVWLINRLVEEGKNIENAIEMIVLDSNELGNYLNSQHSTNEIEPTGSRFVCGVYDLANVSKILVCSNEQTGGFWLGQGNLLCNSDEYPLAFLDFIENEGYLYFESVGWLVL